MTIDYKNTLNLPHTDFPMKADLPKREPNLLARWQALDIYQRLRDQGKARPKFILHDGPPYANGSIHLGHAVNKVLKDIIIKAKTLSGFDTPYVPGWDCHGLPIELNVEKKIGKVGVKVTPKEFRKASRQYATEQVALQRDAFMRLGVIGDWDHPYLTMDHGFEANIIRTLGRIIEKGYLHRGYKPVHWCMDCGSALAEAEVEYEDKTSIAIDVRFKVLDEDLFWQRCHHVLDKNIDGPLSVVIWTTTPWTLPANQAVALNPTIEYVIVECNGQYGKEYLFLAEALLKEAMGRYAINDYRIKAYCRGDAVEGLKLQHPFYDRQVPLVVGDHVTLEAGTGAVHTAPGHGLDDYATGLRYGLPVDHAVKANGCFEDSLPLFGGLPVLKANEKVVEVLKAHGGLVHSTMVTHSYPHCWRHKSPLIFRGTPQWFISMSHNSFRHQVLQQIEKVQWIPEWGQARISDMIAKRPDWCISRQRTWGVPIPLFLHKKTHALHPDTVALLEKIALKVEAAGIDAWDDLTPELLLGNDAGDYMKLTDTLDVWFEAGASYAAVLQENPALRFPADLYLEGSDQHRGWFHTSLLSSVAATGQAPYRAVLTHGFTVDTEGRKMSKSLGNVIAPEKVISNLGADVLRLWIASTDYRAEMTVSDEILKRTADLYRRIRNTARFLLSNLSDFDPTKDLIENSKLLVLDQFIVDRARLLQLELREAFDNYQFHQCCQKIHHFCAVDLGSFYLDIIKDRQYTTQKDSLARRSTQTAMYHLLEAMVRWLAPILTFTAEEIWEYMPGNRAASVFMAEWYQDLLTLPENSAFTQSYWQTVMDVRNAVNKELEQQRAAEKIGSGLQAEVELYCTGDLATVLSQLGDELRFVLITSKAKVIAVETAPTDAVATELANLWLKVSRSTRAKCVRCWHYSENVGVDLDHPELCGRCVSNVVGKGEARLFA